MKKNNKKTADCCLCGDQVAKGIDELKKLAKVAKSKYKKPDELSFMRDESAKDILKNLGPISKEEVEYYESL